MDKTTIKKFKKKLIKKFKKNKLFFELKQFKTAFLQKKIKTEEELLAEKHAKSEAHAKKQFKKANRKNKIMRILKKLSNFINTILDKEDRKTILSLIAKVVLFGIPVNFAVFVVSKGFYTFNSFTWIGWGLALWILKKEIEPMLRGIIHK